MSPRPAVVFAILLLLALTSAVAEETPCVAAISPLSGPFGLIGDETIKVALALEAMVFDGPEGRVWMRPEDHQLIAPLYLARLGKAGEPGIQFDVQSTGMGWKTIAKVEGKDLIPPIKYTVERPAM